MTCVRRQSVRNVVVPRRPRSPGFTLIEVLMAAFVIAIGVLGLTALFAGAARQQQMSSQSTRSVAHARSADAYISNRFGPIEAVNGGPLTPPVENNQSPTDEVQADQWYALPRTELDGSISVNPRESTTGWKTDSLFTRSEPREALPKLMFRTRMERADNQFVPTGLAGGNFNTKQGLGFLQNDNIGAPAFDNSMRELRILADSIKIRVVTRAFPCSGGTTDERSIVTPDDREIVLRWDSSTVVGKPEEIHLIDGDNEIYLDSKPTAKDAELTTTNGQALIKYAYIADVVDSVIDDPGCGTPQEYWVQVATPVPSECDDAEPKQYVWTTAVANTGDVELDPLPGSGDPGYDLKVGTNAGERYLYAVLRKVDRCNIGSAMFRRVAPGTGAYVITGDGVNPPSPGDFLFAEVRTARFPNRFIHEIWLEDYRYRGHTLVSMPESVTYSQSAEDASQRVPQLGYSMLFRQTADATVQYALFSYAISPTYPATADKVDKTDDDYFPMEDKDSIETTKVAPLRLVKGLPLEFDKDLGQYYVQIDPSASDGSDAPGWIASPGQVLLFNGDSSATPAIPGADAPVRIVNTRKVGGREMRAYLDGPPRAGLRALPDFGSGNTFDAWVVAPKCQVTQRKVGAMSYHWGLKPVEARIFTVSSDQ